MTATRGESGQHFGSRAVLALPPGPSEGLPTQDRPAKLGELRKDTTGLVPRGEFASVEVGESAMGSESIVTGQTPQTVISGGRDYDGFRPSDAALVRAGQSQDAHLHNLVATKDAERAAVETRFCVEKSVKEVELAVERANNTLFREMAAFKSEITAQVQVAAAQTQAQIASGLNASTVELLIRRLLTLRPGAAITGSEPA